MVSGCLNSYPSALRTALLRSERATIPARQTVMDSRVLALYARGAKAVNIVQQRLHCRGNRLPKHIPVRRQEPHQRPDIWIDITHWPPVDVLISFFSTDFPLPKALAYTQLPNRSPPISINSLAMQSLLWDRRLVLAILDHIGVPTPSRAEVSRDGGPFVPRSLRRRVRKDLGLVLPGPASKDEDTWGEVQVPSRWKGKRDEGRYVPRGTEVILREDGDAIIVGGRVVEKPFVEKPVDGEDHNVHIYYRGGGGRRLFRKVSGLSASPVQAVQPLDIYDTRKLVILSSRQ